MDSEAAKAARRKVLVVDDDEGVARIYRRAFADAGFDASAAHGFEEALLAARREPPDLAVVDVVMPGVTGFNLCRALRSQPRTEVFLISGKFEPTVEHFLQGIEAGAAGFYHKFDITVTRSIVGDARAFFSPEPFFAPHGGGSSPAAVAAPPRPADVLIIDDEEEWRSLIATSLDCGGFTPYAAETARRGLLLAHRLRPAAIILDLNLPDLSGADTLRLLKAHSRTRKIPVLMLTGSSAPGRELRCTQEGAAAYLLKKGNDLDVVPIRIRGLMASAGRTESASAGEPSAPVSGGARGMLRAGPVELDLSTRETRVFQRKVEIKGLEFEFLALLARRPGEVLPWDCFEKLREQCDGPLSSRHASKSVGVHLSGLRSKLGRSAACIVTHKGIGLQFDPSRISDLRA